MKKISLALSAGLIVVALFIGIAAGYWLTPEYRLNMYDKNMDLGRADRLFDLRYINAMITHHRGAMLLAEQAKKSQRQEIQELAAAIIENEPKAIDELYNWKKDWYKDSRKSQEPLVAKLGDYDESFDLRFLNALIAHHEEGIKMTKETRLKSSRSEILNNANAVELFLNDGLKMLRGWRTDWYKI